MELRGACFRSSSLRSGERLRAREILREYIDLGVMEHVPMSRGYYRPTKGNFGREA